MEIRTQFDAHARVNADPGNPVKVLYAPQFDKAGNLELVEAGQEDFYGYIQSHKDSVDINNILSRFARGDVSVLQRRQAMFGDFSDAPESYADALNSMIFAEQYFDNLPLDVRAKFDHNFHKFLLSLDAPETVKMLTGNADVVPPSSVASKSAMDMAEPQADAIKTTPDAPST